MARVIDKAKSDALEALARVAARLQYEALIAQANAREASDAFIAALADAKAVAEGRANG